MSEHRSSEWPLVVFTVGLQLCCGITVATTLMDAEGLATTAHIKPLALWLFPIAIAALLASTFHLGRPFSAVRAISNLGESRLSAEVTVTTVFVFCVFAYSVLWLTGETALRIVAGGLTALFGVAAVISSARIYTIPAQPFWFSGWVNVQFLGATLLLGGCVAAFGVRGAASGPASIWISAVTVGAILMLTSAYWMLRRLRRIARTRYEAPCAPPLITPANWGFLIGFILLAAIVPLLLAGSHLLGVGIVESEPAGVAILVLTLIGVTLGRVFMYSLGTELARF